MLLTMSAVADAVSRAPPRVGAMEAALPSVTPHVPSWLLAQAGSNSCQSIAPTGIEDLLVRQAGELYTQSLRAPAGERAALLQRVLTIIDTLVQAQPESLVACQLRQRGGQVAGIPVPQVRAELSGLNTVNSASVAGRSTAILTSNTAATANPRIAIPDTACGPLSPARKAIVRDILKAYRGNLRAIEQAASHADYALLAWATYGGDDAIELARQRGWSEHQSSRNGGFTVPSALGGGDAVARLFVSAQGEAILAFRGTTTKRDWLTNAGTVLPIYSDQLRSARVLADRAQALYPGVTFVGHSLGGAMAQVARLHTGRKAVIFNSAPIGLHALGFAISGQALNTRVSAELVAFRSPEDPVRGATEGIGSFDDVVVGNIALTKNTVFQNVLEGMFATGFAHAMPALARAMQDVRLVRDEGWMAAETSITIQRGESACGFAFRRDGVVQIGPLQIPNAFRSNRGSDGNLPDRLSLYSLSPSGRYRVIQVGLFEKYSERIVDLRNQLSFDAISGFYGSYNPRHWNKSEATAVAVSSDDGYSQIWHFDTRNRSSRAFPKWDNSGDDTNIIVDPASLIWVSDDVYQIDGMVCGTRFRTNCQEIQAPSSDLQHERLRWRRLQFDITRGREIQMRVLGPAQPFVPNLETGLRLAIERLNLPDAASRSLVSSGVEALLASLLSEQSINALVSLGLSREVVEANVLQAVENSVGGLSPSGLATNVVQSAITEAVASALEQAIFSRAPASALPAPWQAPLRALVRSTFAESAGLFFAVNNPNPTAWVAPVVDRVYDSVEIHRGITGLRQDRDVFLYTVAMGAEINAELITLYPGPRSQGELDQWRSQTRDNLSGAVGPGAVESVSQVIDMGQAALIAQRKGNTAEVVQRIQQLQQKADQFNLPTLRGTRNLSDLLLNLVNAGDAASKLASVFLVGTALRSVGQAAISPMLMPPLLAEEGGLVAERCTTSHKCSHFGEFYSQNKGFRDSIDSMFLSAQLPQPNWIRSGVSSRVIPILFGNELYLVGSVCKPHFCNTDSLTVIYSSSKSLVVGELQISDKRSSRLGGEAGNFLRIFSDFSLEGSDLSLALKTSARSLPIIISNDQSVAASCGNSATILRRDEIIKIFSGNDVDVRFGTGELGVMRFGIYDIDVGQGEMTELTKKIDSRDVWSRISRRYMVRDGELCEGTGAHDWYCGDVRRCDPNGLGNRVFWFNERGEVGFEVRGIKKGIELALPTYIAQFPNGRFLNAPDPPGWFSGQCVAWAKTLFGLVASRSIESLRGNAEELPSKLKTLGFQVSEDPATPRVGAMIAWSDRDYGHVGVVTQIHRNPANNEIAEITVSEANWGPITEEGARRWAINLEVARREYVTEMYGVAQQIRLPVSNLNRGNYKFMAYVYP